jgi:hypothetical protein
MTHQVALTIIATVRDGQAGQLKQLLETIGSDAASNALMPFARLSDVHFARLMLLDAATDLDGAAIAPQLVFMSDVDAPLRGHLDQLVDVLGDGIDSIYRHCEGYPCGGPITRGQRLSYLRAHIVRADTVYVNAIGRTVRQIDQEAQLRESIGRYLGRNKHAWPDQGPQQVRAAIQAFVDGDDRLRWARSPAEQPGVWWQIKDRLDLLALPLLVLLLLPAILIGLPFYLALLRLHELRDTAERAAPDEAHIEELASLEDHIVQNQFSAIGFVKPGRFRLLTAITVLWIANWATRHIFKRADLAGVTTIHFARWVFMDDKRRLIFTSNYDGSLESYMDDFIDKVAWGLNASFSNGVGYPRTNWLILDGARDEMAFKQYIRGHQLPTQVWFSAYPDLTALNIENNARIREGLFGSLDSAAAEAWLRRL